MDVIFRHPDLAAIRDFTVEYDMWRHTLLQASPALPGLLTRGPA